jgi:hypothetical protein
MRQAHEMHAGEMSNVEFSNWTKRPYTPPPASTPSAALRKTEWPEHSGSRQQRSPAAE